MKEGDTRKTFTTDAALHIVNKASVDELRQRVLDNHPEGLQDFWVEAEQFRSNIVIDTKEGFSEDLFAEMRIGSCLLRNVGPTIRCNAIRTNYDNKVKVADEEPNRTLTQFRNAEGMGILFGMYYQQDLMTRQDYEYVCTKELGYPSYDDCLKDSPISVRKEDNVDYVMVKCTDFLKVRYFEERAWRKSFK